MDKSTAESIDKKLALFWYSTGIAFRIVENNTFLEYTKALRPGYKPPSRRVLAGSLLSTLYQEELEATVDRLVSCSHLTLVSDGWSNVKNQCITNYVLSGVGIKPAFWKSVNTTGTSHTAQAIADGIFEVIEEVEALVGLGKIVAVVTDNASNMRGAWEIIETKNPDISCNGCGAHVANLLIKDVVNIEEVRTCLDKAAAIAKWFKKRPMAIFKLSEHKKLNKESSNRTLKIPVPTRWYTELVCMTSVFESKTSLKQLFSNDEFLDLFDDPKGKKAAIGVYIMDPTFWSSLNYFCQLLKPLNDLVATFENDGACISLIYDQFAQLAKTPLYNESGSESIGYKIGHCIRSRWNFLHTSSMGIAFLLDHTKNLDDFIGTDKRDSVDQLIDFILSREKDPNLHKRDVVREVNNCIQTLSMRCTERKQSDSYFSPYDFWFHESRWPLVKKAALVVFSIPTSSAASERSFSSHAFIHTKIRNRLSAEKVSMLVFLYSNGGRAGEPDEILYQVHPEIEMNEDDSELGDEAQTNTLTCF